MKTSTQKRIARLSGLLLLSLLVGALVVTAAQAMRDFSGASVPSTAAGSGASNATQGQIGRAWGYYYSDAGAAKLSAATVQRQPGWAWGRYYSEARASTLGAAQRPTLAQLLRAHDGSSGSSAASGGGTVNAAAQSASSGMSSATWIAVAAVAGVLLISGWALLRRRKQREAVTACEFSVQGC